MPPDAREPAWSNLGLPPIDPFVRNLLGGLLALYVAELTAGAAGLPVGALTWRPFGAGFAPWQPLTCYLVQGNIASNVLFGLLGLWFVIPSLLSVLPRRALGEAVLAAIAGGTLLPLAANAAGFGADAMYGWGGLLLPLLCLFGLAFPTGQVRINFVLPVTGPMLVWGSLLLAGLQLLAALGGPGGPLLGALRALGQWIGVYLWWNRRNARRAPAARGPRLRVMSGGRDDLFHREPATP
ncbi:MAG TPA: hypothetical protein PKA64_08870 [Myxococcota bacterium]|nr:hypothetical protein [Myxococcota bacterium]